MAGRVDYATHCQCGCGFDDIDTRLLEVLLWLSHKFNKTVIMTSGCRCVAHNATVGGIPDSKHITGQACDIAVAWVKPQAIADAVAEITYCVTIVYPGHLHIELRSTTE